VAVFLAVLDEARGQRLFGALASFCVDSLLVRAGDRRLMEVLSSPEFRPREL
jgi:hypothetical protein